MIEILKTADIVVTNPPFSLFYKYLQQLVDFDKKFLIVGNINTIKYKDIFRCLWKIKFGSVITADIFGLKSLNTTMKRKQSLKLIFKDKNGGELEIFAGSRI